MKNTLTYMNMKLRGLLKREEGQGMVEYALIVGAIALVIIVVVALFGEELSNYITNIFSSFPGNS